MAVKTCLTRYPTTLLGLVDVSPWAWAAASASHQPASSSRTKHLPATRPDIHIVPRSRLPHAHEHLIRLHTTLLSSHSIFYAPQHRYHERPQASKVRILPCIYSCRKARANNARPGSIPNSSRRKFCHSPTLSANSMLTTAATSTKRPSSRPPRTPSASPTMSSARP